MATIPLWAVGVDVQCFVTPYNPVLLSDNRRLVYFMGMNNIISACFWKSSSCFISYYLKDLTGIEGDMFTLGKLSVPASAIV